ncbi:MAG: hypothetical protein ACPGXK_05915 [Phycisphaerae bacterium]
MLDLTARPIATNLPACHGYGERRWRASAMPTLMLMLAVSGILTQGAGTAHGEAIDVPNGSFESPLAPRVSPFARPAFYNDGGANGWIQVAPPEWWSFGDVPWDQSAGVFFNVDGALNIENADGEQLVFMFGTPDLAIYQELDATFEQGRSYTLRVGVRGGSGGMPIDAPLEVSLYFRNEFDEITTVAATTFLNDTLGSPTALLDVEVELDTVAPDAPWAGESIGILIRPLVELDEIELQGGTWGIDNVRLEAQPDAIIIGDTDQDGDVDLIDYASWQDCLYGPDILIVGSCENRDFNDDQSVDLYDYAIFQSALTD